MQYIELTKEEAIAIIRLNRPAKMNAIFQEMAAELQNTLNELSENNEIRAVILTANGDGFCAGQDLKEAVEYGKDPDAKLSTIVRNTYNPIVKAITGMPKPVIAAVNGTAAGAGANLALACDVVLASSKAKFVQSFTGIALIPDTAGTWMLPRLVGLARAKYLALTAEEVTPEYAEKTGMIHSVVDHSYLESEALKMAKKFTSMPTQALAFTKKALNQSFENTLDDQLELEAELQEKAGLTEDFNEGINAFVEKREPRFTGK